MAIKKPNAEMSLVLFAIVGGVGAARCVRGVGVVRRGGGGGPRLPRDAVSRPGVGTAAGRRRRGGHAL